MYNPIEVSQAASKAREELEKSGQVGRTEKQADIIWNGQTDDTLVIMGGVAQVSDNTVDLTAVERVVLNYGLVLDTSDLGFVNIDEYTSALFINAHGFVNTPAIAICTKGHFVADYGYDVPRGTYLLDNGETFVTRVEFAETIHPIDPKFLPGVCLPMVELSTVPTEEGAALSAEDAAKMDALNGGPCILKVPQGFDTTDTLMGFPFVVKTGAQVSYMFATPHGYVAVACDVSGWTVGVLNA